MTQNLYYSVKFIRYKVKAVFKLLLSHINRQFVTIGVRDGREMGCLRQLCYER